MDGTECSKVSAALTRGMSPHRAGEFWGSATHRDHCTFLGSSHGRGTWGHEEYERWHHGGYRQTRLNPGCDKGYKGRKKVPASQKLKRILTDEEELRFGRNEIGEACPGRQVLQERKHRLCRLSLNPSAITTQVIWSELLTSPSLSFLVYKMDISDPYRINSSKY